MWADNETTVDLLGFQVNEIAAAGITSESEDTELSSEEAVLAQVGALRLAMAEARDCLAGSDASLAQSGLGASDLLGRALLQLSSYESLADLAEPLRAAQADVEDVVRELRLRDERLDEDPELFFPIGNTGPALRQIEKAKVVCRRCEVIEACLSWATESGKDDGVWGD